MVRTRPDEELKFCPDCDVNLNREEGHKRGCPRQMNEYIDDPDTYYAGGSDYGDSYILEGGKNEKQE